jgi:hypothetical protein
MALNSSLATPAVGTAVMSIAACSEANPRDEVVGVPSLAAGPVGAFLHGLLTKGRLTREEPFVWGGIRVTDTATGTTWQPGCCGTLEERSYFWLYVIDGSGSCDFGHDPSALAERAGDLVRFTADSEEGGSPAFDVPVEELKRLLDGVERDLEDFVALVADWAAEQVPSHAGELMPAIARAMELPLRDVRPDHR